MYVCIRFVYLYVGKSQSVSFPPSSVRAHKSDYPFQNPPLSLPCEEDEDEYIIRTSLSPSHTQKSMTKKLSGANARFGQGMKKEERKRGIWEMDKMTTILFALCTHTRTADCHLGGCNWQFRHFVVIMNSMEGRTAFFATHYFGQQKNLSVPLSRHEMWTNRSVRRILFVSHIMLLLNLIRRKMHLECEK